MGDLQVRPCSRKTWNGCHKVSNVVFRCLVRACAPKRNAVACVQEMLQHELNRFQTNPSDVRIDPDASTTGDSFNHSRAHELRYDDDILGSPQPLISRTAGGAKRSRSTRKGKLSKSEQRCSHVRSSCADEIIAAALGDDTNKRSSKSPDPTHNISRRRNAHSSLYTQSLAPAPIHLDPSRECASLLSEWGVSESQPECKAPNGTENASAQLNSLERLLDDSVAERGNVAHKEVRPSLLL